MNTQEQLTAFQQKRNDAAARMKSLMDLSAEEGRTLDKEEADEYESLKTEVKHLEAHLTRLREVAGEDDTTKEVVKSKGPTILVRSQDKEDAFQGQSYVRRIIAKSLAQLGGFEQTASQIAEHRWGKTHPNLVRVIKAAVASGGTISGEWAAELVQADTRYTGDFIAFLTSKTVYDKLPLREVPAHVVIKGQDGSATGAWVGEGLGIPVSAQDYSTVSLAPLKVAALSVVSKELLKHSSPSAEMLVRDSLVDASGQAVDSTFLSTDAAVSNVSPAGLLVSPLAAIESNGLTAAALRQDVYELYAVFLTNKNADGLYLVMQPSLAKAISLLNNALGQTEFPGLSASGGTLLGDPVVTGDNVTTGHMILLKPTDIYKIGDTGVEVSLSMDATIEQNTVPLGDTFTPTAASATLMSMFQTDSVAFKVVRPINYAKRRSHAVQYVADAFYGIPDSTTA
jgi:HK97 family phage major capsid protein